MPNIPDDYSICDGPCGGNIAPPGQDRCAACRSRSTGVDYPLHSGWRDGGWLQPGDNVNYLNEPEPVLYRHVGDEAAAWSVPQIDRFLDGPGTVEDRRADRLLDDDPRNNPALAQTATPRLSVDLTVTLDHHRINVRAVGRLEHGDLAVLRDVVTAVRELRNYHLLPDLKATEAALRAAIDADGDPDPEHRGMTDPDPIAQLDFTPRLDCGCTDGIPNRGPCPYPAAWTLTSTCPGCGAPTLNPRHGGGMPVCEGHRAVLMARAQAKFAAAAAAGDTLMCGDCDHPVRCADDIATWTPLGTPGA